MTVPPDDQVPETPTPDESHPAAFPTTPTDMVGALPSTTDAGTTRALANLLRLSPFLDLYERVGNGKLDAKGRVCFLLDLVVRLVVVGLLLGTILAVAWKTLAPLPPLRSPPATSETP